MQRNKQDSSHAGASIGFMHVDNNTNLEDRPRLNPTATLVAEEGGLPRPDVLWSCFARILLGVPSTRPAKCAQKDF